MNKLNKHIKTLLITVSFLLCSAGIVQAASFDGGLDLVSGEAISGWAKDASTPDNPVSVSIFITPEGSTEAAKEMTITASDYRDADQHATRAAGYCGFHWNVDWSELDNGDYQISMMAGSRNIRKTVSYTNTVGKEKPAPEPEADQPAAAEGARSLGVFKTTAYCPCQSCSEGWGRKTSTGATARARHTIAVDPRVIPYGSKVMIDGIIYTAEDRGGAVKGNHIDVFYDSHSETRQHGVRYREVFLLP